MTTRRVGNRAILRLAIPALGTLAVDPLLTLVDTAFVARVGVDELAALGVDTAILGFVFFGFNFLAYATTPLVAQALGRGDSGEARRWVGDALVLAVLLGLLATAILETLAPWLVGLMGAEPNVADPAVSYLRIRAIATPAVLVVTTGHGAFRGYQDTRTPFLVAVGVNCCAPAHVLAAVESAVATTGLPAICYPNSGESWAHGADDEAGTWSGESTFDVGLAPSWVDAGARYVGGCCRVGPAQIADLTARLNVTGTTPDR